MVLVGITRKPTCLSGDSGVASASLGVTAPMEIQCGGGGKVCQRETVSWGLEVTACWMVY